MNNYLLQLLKDIKTIIIPGLGAITLTNELTGEMMFMPYLKYDDGNLARHISEKEGMDLNEAKNLIAKFVREVQAELDKGNSYDMYQFGSFQKIDGEVAFVQWQAGSGTTETPKTETFKVPEPPVEQVAPIRTAEPEPPVAESIPVVEPAPEPVKPVEMPEETPVAHTEPVKEEKPAPEVVIETAATTAAMAETLSEAPKQKAVTPKERAIAAEKAKKEAEAAKAKAQADAKKQKEAAAAARAKAKADAKKQKQSGNADNPAGPKKKMRWIGYVLWGFIVLFLGGATYVAFNFNTLKHDFPLLADLAGDNNDKAIGDKEIKAALDSANAADANMGDMTLEDSTDDLPELNPEEVAPNPLPDEAPVEEPVAEEVKPVSKPKQTAKPWGQSSPTPAKPVKTPKPSNSGSYNGGGSIGSPDPSRPFHIIGGSFGSESNAKRFARELIAKGQPSVVVGEFNGMYRVSVASYATESEAKQAHSGLKDVVPQSWVFRWP